MSRAGRYPGLVVVAAGVLGALLQAAPPVPEVFYTPDDVLKLVAEDLSSRAYSPTTRYLSLDNLPDEKAREDMQTVMCGHLQTLSSEPGISLPTRVGPLLRIDTTDYGEAFAEQWERLGRQEPFWHGDDIAVEDEYEDRPFGFYFDEQGRQFTEPGPGRTFRATETRRVKVADKGKARHIAFVRTADGKSAIETIALKTRGTDVPVVRATWFLAQTAVSWQRDPGYYEFAGYQNLKEFERAIGFIRKGQSKGFLRDLRAATASSQVTTPDTLRRIIRFQAPSGGYWFTQDSDQRLAKFDPKANPVSNLGDDYIFQAIEAIGYGPNGWPKTGLFDDKGERQDRAPDNIAGTKRAPVRDTRIHVNISCADCHVKNYLQDVDDWVRTDQNVDGLLGTKLGIEKARELRSQYVTQYIEPNLKKDRDAYEAVVWQTVRMKPDAWTKLYVKSFHAWADEPVTLEQAARELGCSPDKVVQSFKAQGERLDSALHTYRNKKPRAIPRVVWESSFQRAADAVYGVARPFAVKEKVK